MIVLEKQFLKAFHNIEHEPFKISMEIFLPIDFAYIVYAHCMCTKRDLLKSQGNNCLPLKIRNSSKTELMSVKSAKVSPLLCFHRCPCVTAVPVNPQQFLKQ